MKQCNTCKGKYQPLQDNKLYFHACPLEIRDSAGKLVKTPNPRDENIVDERLEKDVFEDAKGKGRNSSKVHIINDGDGSTVLEDKGR